MSLNKELVLLRKFFKEFCRWQNAIDAESVCRTWQEARIYYPTIDAFWPKAQKLIRQISDQQATISLLRGKRKTTRKSSSFKREKAR